MEGKADVGSIIFIVKERNRYLAALKEINRIASSIDGSDNSEQAFNLISELCKKAISSPRKIRAEVKSAMLLLTPRLRDRLNEK